MPEGQKQKDADAGGVGRGTPLRIIIGLTVGLCVALIAGSTLAVVSLFARSAIEGIAADFSISLLISARNRAEKTLSTAAKAMMSLSIEMRRNGSALPTDGQLFTPPMDHTVMCPPFRNVELTNNNNYTSIEVLYRDGSAFRVDSYETQGQVACSLQLPSDPQGTVLPSTRWEYFYTDTKKPVPAGNALAYAQRWTAFDSARDAAKYARIDAALPPGLPVTGVVPRWVGFEAYSRGTAAPPRLNLVLAARAFNRSNKELGVIALQQSADPLHEALQALQRTDNSRVFVIYNGTMILGSTEPTLPIRTYAPLAACCATVKQGECFSSRDEADQSKEQVICPAFVDTYGYAPLKQVRAARPDLVHNRGAVPTAIEMDIGGTLYFVGSAPVSLFPAAGGMDISILFLMPKDDVTGAVTQGTYVVIGVACGILVLATVLAVVVVVRVLKPLEIVSFRMNNASKLDSGNGRKKRKEKSAAAVPQVNNDADEDHDANRDGDNDGDGGGDDDDDDDDPDSSIAEIAALSASFVGMASALKSFEKYIPREVIKDLMLNDELCKLGMKPHTVSSLATDIAGFTSVSERTKPDELGRIINIYFERLCAIIDRHSGVVTIFIGDAIISHWNSPAVCANHELKACLCALEMQRELCMDPIKRTWEEVGEAPTTRIGLHVSEALCGNFGSQNRMTYATMGEGISIGAELEANNKPFGTRINISGDLELKVRNLLCCRFLMPVHFGCMRDEHAAVQVYALHGILPKLDLNAVLQGDENSVSQSMLSERSGGRSGAGTGTGGMSQSQQTAAREAMARRIAAKSTVKQLARRAVRHETQMLVVSDQEAQFCAAFSRCAERFAAGDAQGCVALLAQLRRDWPAFFAGGEQLLPAAIGPSRCEAVAVRAEYSAKMLEKRCAELLRDNVTDLNQFMLRH